MERARVFFREAGSLGRRLRNDLETAVRSRSVGQGTPPHKGLQGREPGFHQSKKLRVWVVLLTLGQNSSEHRARTWGAGEVGDGSD